MIPEAKINITLIGMPGAGKSTTGVILAKLLSFGFLDTDLLIQLNLRRSLQEIVDRNGHIHLRKVEEEEILKICPEKYVIATGGSAVYSHRAMEHLARISTIIFLRADFDVIEKRIRNFDQRGIAKAKNQTFRDLFMERQPLYERYAEIQIDCNTLTQDEAAESIVQKINKKRKGFVI